VKSVGWVVVVVGGVDDGVPAHPIEIGFLDQVAQVCEVFQGGIA
jgi:hypothetical protein